MYKNQLQELAQRSCFNLPSYACIREGPDHAPRFKATVNFNGEMFECPAFFSTLRLAEHAAAEVALNTLSKRGPSRTLAAKVLDETGVYKNLLQETAHRAGMDLPVYTTVRSGPGHVPVFSCTVELGGMSFTGELAKTKKQAQKNAAMSAWGNLKEMSQSGSSSSLTNSKCLEEQEQIVVARFLASQNIANSSNLPKSMQKGHPRPSTTVKGSLSPTSGSVDSYYQNWASSNLSQEMAMHRIWQEEYQRRLIAHGFPFLPVPPPRQVVPWMHPALQPSNYPHCFTTDQQPFSATPGISIVSSPLCFSDQLVPGPIETRFMVTIQDTQRDNPEDSCKLSPPEVPVISNNSDFAVDEKLKDEGKENRCESTGLQPGEAQLQNSIGVESSRPSTDMSRAPSSYPENIRVALPVASPAAPVVYNQGNFRPPYSAPRMRSGINSFLRRPMLGRMQARSFHTPYMAPAVQIRSVVPVCSAAPPRKMASSCLQRPTTDNVRNEATGDNVSRISSNLENLHV